MSYHIRIREVDDYNVIVTRSDGCIKLLGNLGSAHLRFKIVGRNCRRIDKDTALILVGLLKTAVEEEGNVCVLLGLGKTELLKSQPGKIFTEGIYYLLLLKCDELVGDRLIIILEAYICKRHEAVSSL